MISFEYATALMYMCAARVEYRFSKLFYGYLSSSSSSSASPSSTLKSTKAVSFCFPRRQTRIFPLHQQKSHLCRIPRQCLDYRILSKAVATSIFVEYPERSNLVLFQSIPIYSRRMLRSLMRGTNNRSRDLRMLRYVLHHRWNDYCPEIRTLPQTQILRQRSEGHLISFCLHS